MFFLGAAVLIGVGIAQHRSVLLTTGAACVLGFIVAVIAHVRVIALRDRANVRCTVHQKHLERIDGKWWSWPYAGQRLFAEDHPYAADLDLEGPSSLLARIAVTHTKYGERTLTTWLGSVSAKANIEARQVAVRELSTMLEFRQELEAGGLAADGSGLDASPFLELAQRQRWLAGAAWALLIYLLPLLSGALLCLAVLDLVMPGIWLAVFIAQCVVVFSTNAQVGERYDRLVAGHRWVEAFEDMLQVIERTEFNSAYLQQLKADLKVDGKLPSAQLRRLRVWAGLLDLRTQGLFHIFVNPFLLWDLHCMRHVERWNEEVGRKAHRWFEVVGEYEGLCSLATLACVDPAETFPYLVYSSQPLVVSGIKHPLLPADERVANDVKLMGRGSALIITGSNMAGKSTLLRAVGLNGALALAGGPVCADVMQMPLLRLRASMRAEDSLRRGASYFQAELLKLQAVIKDAEREPPIFFLLDELLRGTNAHARHQGARAIVLHLLKRCATGIVATHDTKLAELEGELGGRVANAHFTDVAIHGEMTFDYRLRPGVVRTSNALRLLRAAGVDVDVDDELHIADS